MNAKNKPAAAVSQRAVTNAAVCDPVKKQAIAEIALAAFCKHGTLAAAARVAKVDRRTLRAWIRSDPLLKAAFAEADDELTDAREESAIQQALNGNARLMIHLLASRRTRYSHKTTVVVEPPTLDGIIEQMRQAALAQPVLAPMLRTTLQRALEAIP